MIIGSEKVKYGAYAFTGCESLTTFSVNASVLPEGMFYECLALETVTIGPDVNDVGPFAFRSTKVSAFNVEEGNSAFKVQNAAYILSADGSAVIAVAPTFTGMFGAEQLGGAEVSVVGKGAFSHNIRITDVVLPGVTKVGEYGFGSSTGIENITVGTLTEIGDYAFFETDISKLPGISSDTILGKYAFSHTGLISVTIPDGMTLPEGIFSECMKLETVVIGDNVTIGKFAFSVDKDKVFEIKNYNEDGEKYFYYVFKSGLKNLTIGENAVIGDNAFACAASLESVTLGANASIGYMAFYNNASLKQIDLSQAVSIGDYAFSGDVYYVCLDDQMTVAAVSKDGKYIYTYHAPKLTNVELNSAASIGEYCFSYCRDLTDVTLNDSITEIPAYAFAGCVSLKNIDLSKIVTVGDNAFIEDAALENIDLSSAQSIGEYAFVYCVNLESIKLSENGTDIGEGAFSYCEKLSAVENLGFSENIDSYAFAYSAITVADLSGAVSVGDFVFLKEEMTPFKVTMGNAIVSLGDNPFAMCKLEPFAQKVTTSFNGTDYESYVYTFNLSDTVFVIDGSLYCMVDNGMEMIVYAGDSADVKIADDTIRIGAYAFAGSSVKIVTVPYTVKSIGHKAFFGCSDLKVVSLSSYEAPILEEEFDSSYYESFENIPGTGDFGSYNDYDGTEIVISGMGLLPYYMWNATDGMYSNVFYGANFVDYVGKVENKLTLIRPSNGQHYDTFIFGQYFDTVIDGAAGADDVTLNAIAAITLIPERVSLSDKDTVLSARDAYDKIATMLQRGLVTNYDVLVSAEQRIKALESAEDPSGDPTDDPVEDPSEIDPPDATIAPSQSETNPSDSGDTNDKKTSSGWIAWLVIIAGILGVSVAVIVDLRKKSNNAE